jgi:pimeloyl-ACP methyl ester carboxylesterase
MKKLSLFLQISFLSIFNQTIAAQEEIHYGSNNGQYISVQNTRIYYEEYGEGTPLLLFHGGLGSISYFAMVIPELSNHFKIIAIDQPGHGRSYHADSMSYQLMSDYMSEMIDLMELDSVYILGCSMGSNLALHLAYDRPDKVKRIISDGGIVKIEGSTLDMFDFTEKMGHIENRPESWINWYHSVNPQKDRLEEFLQDISRMRFDGNVLTDSEIRNIKAKTLIMMGDRDFAIKLYPSYQVHCLG